MYLLFSILIYLLFKFWSQLNTEKFTRKHVKYSVNKKRVETLNVNLYNPIKNKLSWYVKSMPRAKLCQEMKMGIFLCHQCKKKTKCIFFQQEKWTKEGLEMTSKVNVCDAEQERVFSKDLWRSWNCNLIFEIFNFSSFSISMWVFNKIQEVGASISDSSLLSVARCWFLEDLLLD